MFWGGEEEGKGSLKLLKDGEELLVLGMRDTVLGCEARAKSGPKTEAGSNSGSSEGFLRDSG